MTVGVVTLAVVLVIFAVAVRSYRVARQRKRRVERRRIYDEQASRQWNDLVAQQKGRGKSSL